MRRANARIRHRLWGYDPVAFIHDCIEWPEGQGPTEYQEEALSALVEHGRVAVRGPHGLGKTSSAAWAILWFGLTRDELSDWKTPTTASAWRQLDKYLWPEVHKWVRYLRWDRLRREPFKEGSELLDTALQLNTGEAFAVASNRPELMEGAHADSLFYLFDEAKTIQDETWDAGEGAFAGAGEDTDNEAFALAISTPGPPRGAFYEIHQKKRSGWWTRHVTLEEAIAAKRISRSWAEARKRDWGEKSSVFINRVLGDFAAEDENAAIPIAWIEESNRRWEELREEGAMANPITEIGCDPADTGKDMTVIVPKRKNFVEELRYFPGGGRTEEGEPDYGAEVMATSGRLIRMLQSSEARAGIDVGGGWGAAIVGRLREQMPKERGRIMAFNGMVPTKWKDSTGELEFQNVRAAAYWHLRERLNPESDEPIALPPDDRLTGDLTEPKWIGMTSSGKIRLEAKDDIKERLGRSPDAGDAVVMACWLTLQKSKASTGLNTLTGQRF